LYRAAALIPGVKVIPHVTNALGQPGIAVAWGNGEAVDSHEWIFNPVTYQFIGEQDSGVSTAIVAEGFAVSLTLNRKVN
jgi:hypothetical protein